MNFKRPMLGALGLLAMIATPVLAAGLWPNLPIVGSASFCSSTNTAGVPGTSSVCTTTTPAGPATLTGLETMPADTHAASGAPPQTVNVPINMVRSGTYVAPVVASGATVTIPNLVANYIMLPGGTLATLTVTMPSSPADGQVVNISSSNTITTLTVSGNTGQSVSNAPTALTVSTTGSYGYSFMYRASNTTWYRVR